MEIWVIGLLIALISSVLAKRRANKTIDRELDVWAEQLGMVRVGNDLFGARGDVPVGARLALDDPQERSPRWTVQARLQPPLDLGLTVFTRGHVIEDVMGGYQTPTGDAAFDDRFVVRGDEPARVHALLTPRIRRGLLQSLHPQAVFMLTDHGVALQTTRLHANLPWLTQATALCANIAREVNSERAAVPVASTLVEHRRAWSRFASHHALHGISAPLCMWGSLAGATIYAYSVRVARGSFCLEVWLRFEEPLGLGLLIQPMRTVDRMKELFSGADHKLGDEEFDETFLVRLADVQSAEALLDDELRNKLLSMHATIGPLSLMDDGLLVRLPHVPVDPAVVPTTVGHMLSLAQHIAEKRGLQRRGPYR